MARLGVKPLLFLSLFFCAFTLGRTQLPAWAGQFGNLNITVADLLKQLNVTDGQNMVQAIYKALSNLNYVSIFEAQVMDSFKDINLGACGRDYARIRNNTAEMLAYIDAAGKPQSGLLRGNNYWGVAVEQCRAIPNSRICGSAFTLYIPGLPLPIPPVILWGGCFPRSCTPTNVSAVLNAVQSQVPKLTGSKVYLIHHGSKCVEKPTYTSGAIGSLVLCAILLLMCLIGTIFDLIIQAYGTPEESDRSNNIELQPAKTTLESPLHADVTTYSPRKFLKSTFCEVFLCFSLTRNTRKIFNTNVPSAAITSINGIRVISIVWVILGHTFLLMIMSPVVENKWQIDKDARRLSVMPVINAFYAVDSFFFLSGLLVAYTCFRKMAKGDGNFNWILFYVHRFWRLTPSYMFVILFSVHLKGFLSDSPTWYSYYKEPLCSEYWWTNLLYINNFHPKEFTEECIGWTWYLANDMQFFVITPLLLILVSKYKWRGLAASTGTLLMISTIVTATLYGYYELDPNVNLKVLQDSEAKRKRIRLYNNYIYSKPYCRIPPYLVGFILGYVMYTKYSGPKRRGWLIAVVGWSMAFALGMTLVYAPHESVIPGNREWGQAENVIFGMLQRFLWGVALAWVTFACHNGYGGLIQEFLSARFWIPLSRLTYSVYLIHMIVLSVMYLASSGTIYYDLVSISYYFIAATVLSYAVGFILAVVIEFPSENLENLALKLFRGRKKYALNS